MSLLRAYLVFIVSASIFSFAGCGTSSSPSTPVSGNPLSGPSATYVYSVQQTTPETVLRFQAAMSGAVSPSATVAMPAGWETTDIKVDASGSLYVSGITSASGLQQILVYASGAITPTRTLMVSDTGPIAVDSTGKIYLAGQINNTVYVYAASANGTPMPVRTFTFNTPSIDGIPDMAVDSSNNIYLDIVNNATGAGQIEEFGSSATGVATPTRTLTLTGFSYGFGLDAAGNIYASSTIYGGSNETGTIEVFGTSSSTPTRTITPTLGAATVVGGVKVDSAGYAYALIAYGASNSTASNVALVTIGPLQNGSVIPVDVETSTLLTSKASYQIALK